jgi:hypothetical protein
MADNGQHPFDPLDHDHDDLAAEIIRGEEDEHVAGLQQAGAGQLLAGGNFAPDAEDGPPSAKKVRTPSSDIWNFFKKVFVNGAMRVLCNSCPQRSFRMGVSAWDISATAGGD